MRFAAPLLDKLRTCATNNAHSMNHPGFHAPSGVLRVGRSVGYVLGIVLGFGFSRWHAAQSVHEALLVMPGDVVGGDVFGIA